MSYRSIEIPYKKEEGETDTQGEHHVTVKVEIGAMRLQAQEH